MTSTIDIQKISKNNKNIEISKYNGSLKLDEFREKVVPELKEYIYKALNENSEAYFELYEHEERFYLELELFGKLGLDDSRYNTVMYTDGTKGYVIEYELAKYEKEYIILYKPHPRELPTEEQEEYLNLQNIKVLPGNIPMEVISFVYPNLKLGGFDSSLYMSVEKGKTLFFFAKDKKELLNLLDMLYDTLFIGAEFYY